MADGSNHIDEYDELQDEHEALSLKPSERARFEERLKRSAKTMQLHGHLQAFAKLRPDDRALLERAVTYWGKVLDKDRRGEGVDPLVKRVWESGQSSAKRKAAKKGARARFGTQAIDPQRVTGIDEWHSAAEDGRTIFPKSVTAAWDTDRLLVSGHNNAKLGRAVEKGEWAGMPIFHLTLEERATCPRTCEQWLTCLTPDARVLTADLRWQPIGELIVGQRIVGFDEHPVGAGRWGSASGHRMTQISEVEKLGRAMLPCYRITTDRGEVVASSNHMWLARRIGGSGGTRAYSFDWHATENLKPGTHIRFLSEPWEHDTSYEAGRVRGFVEGEGCITVQSNQGYAKPRAAYSQRPGKLLDEINEIVVARGFDIASRLVRSGINSSLVAQVDITGGWREVLRFLGVFRPTRLIERAEEIVVNHSASGRASEVAVVLSVEPVGVREVVTIQTSTRTLIAEGLFSHNCYGNAMHLARRHDARSANFLDFLRAELWLMARSFPKGFVVRLHTLGDFHSVEYVDFWRDMLEALPMLRAWGYTARLEGDPIGDALRALTATHWDRFAIRWSNTPAPQGAIVIDEPGEAGDAILCPAQHTAAEDEAKTDSCATCGLCWSNAVRGKTIAFLRHGMKTRGASDAGSP